MAEQRGSIFDVFTGVTVRAGLKNMITFGLDRAQRKAPNVFNALAWMHLKPSGRQARAWFQGSIVVVGTWLDWLASRSSLLPNQVKEAVESGFQDMPGSFTNYFENHQAQIHLPDGYEGPKNEEEVKALVKDFQTFLGAEISSDLPGLLGTFGQSRWATSAQRFYRSLTTSDNPVFVWWFLQYFEDLTGTEKEHMLVSLEYFDSPAEQKLFMDAGPEGRRRMIAMATKLKNLGFLPTISRQLRENYPKFEREFDKLMTPAADTLRSMADAVELDTAIRKTSLAEKWSLRKPKKANPRLWIILLVVVVGPIILFLSGWGIVGCMTKSHTDDAAQRNAQIAKADSLDLLQHEQAREFQAQQTESDIWHPSGANDSTSNRR